MGNLVMPKNSAELSEMQAVLKVYYDSNDWIENSIFIDKMKALLGEPHQEPQAYTKKTQIPSYFGFTIWEDLTSNQSRRKITDSGKRFYEALITNNTDSILEELMLSLEHQVFGRNVCGCSSDSDIEPPQIFIKCALALGFLTRQEFGYILWQLDEQNESLFNLVTIIAVNRVKDKINYNSIPPKFGDAKPITALLNWNFLEKDGKVGSQDKIIINKGVLLKYIDRLQLLRTSNSEILKFKAPIEIQPEKSLDLDNLKNRFADWLKSKDKIRKNYFSNNFNSNIDRFINALDEYEGIYKEEFGTLVFNTTNHSLEDFIAELENNLYQDSGKFFDFSEKKSTHMPRAILGKNNYLAFLYELLKKQNKSNAKSPKDNPVNKIYFGAPGTGKSYQITEDLKDVDLIFQKRVTFHPEYDNASFVGGYMPITDINGNIKYEFIPQIFTNIYVEACNDPFHQYYLILEEINRGNCAEIFGELFQLLDRNENYKITPSNELVKYLKNNISNSEYYSDDKMLLPDNLSILATMNTSDQSLFPMDSAFKRRWEWEYIPINYNTDSKINKSASFKIQVGKDFIDWISFINSVNKKIQRNPNLGMDKCIGNYFIEPDSNNIITLDKFIYKVIFYLWNDVFKDEPNDSIFGNYTYENFFPLESEGEQLVRKILAGLDLIKPEYSAAEFKSED